ncbi:MAG: gamma-glutamyl-gamma-aminobutyrate hydrolase family protein [Verrucomicrobia bacterium]|nr:gamma-glutamyl-gamma-aminobutyrate hydrolase family protein [Verrucomicrobiota bacterium]
MKSAPLILISPSTQRSGVEFYDYAVSLSDAYPRAVAAAGGIPWILSCTPSAELIAESVRRCGGVLLTGGDDIQPGIHTRKVSARLRETISEVDPIRDLTELLLIREVVRRRKPLLAICRGQQILNVAFGGTLFMDIARQKPKALNHSRSDLKDQIVHDIRVFPDSLLWQVFGKETLGVNSSHHQAIDRLAAPFAATAVSADGIIEAAELRATDKQLSPYLLAVQFHPERLIERHPEFLELFRSFIQACASESKRTL